MKTSILGAAAATVFAATAVHAGGWWNHPDNGQSLVGTWNVKMTPYVCATGLPVPNATFDYIVSFHEGGTLTETSANASFQPGQRAPGLGEWGRAGRGVFASRAKAFILFTTVVTPPAVPRYVRGAQQIEWEINMKGADGLEAFGPVTFMDEAGNGVPPSGCVRAVGTRL